jgi:expansin (peptidoglycan-binding protein)
MSSIATSRFFIMVLIASVLALCLVSSVDAKREPRAARVLLNKRSKLHTPTSSSSASSSSSSSGSFSGSATWFVPSTEGGSTGACGGNEADNAMIVALNSKQYGDMSSKSKYCGQQVKITHAGKSVTATVSDACPECAFGDLDLTQKVFAALGSLGTGVLDISWDFV